MIYSKQRELILNTLLECRSHPTAEDLYAMLKNEHPGLSLATVYRNLNQLAENGMILKIPVPRSADRFDGTLAAHHHMVCRECGKVVDVPQEITDGFPFGANNANGNVIEDFKIIFYGVCSLCNSCIQ